MLGHVNGLECAEDRARSESSMRQFNRTFGALLTGCALVSAALFVAAPQMADAAPPKDKVKVKATPEHLIWAQLLVETTPASANEYGEPSKVSWKGDNGKRTSSNNTKCGSLVSQVIRRAYDPEMESWAGCNSPNAKTYHDLIEDERGFDLISFIDDIKPGDVMAIEYFDMGCKNHGCGTVDGCVASGHTALVAAKPVRHAPTAPLVPGTLQYSVEVIDSSSSFHGTADTRYRSEADKSHDRGVGRGTMRLYVDAKDPDHPVVGYTWSLDADSEYKSSPERDLLIGRYAK